MALSRIGTVFAMPFIVSNVRVKAIAGSNWSAKFSSFNIIVIARVHT